MTLPRLYQDMAQYWPLLSPPSDYVAEAELLKVFIDEQSKRLKRKPTLLELGVGGGHTLSHLAKSVEAVGVDLSPAMLANCRRLVPSAELVEADLLTVRLGRTFDLVFLHDAADYLRTEREIDDALATVAQHLAPGGIAAIAPTYVRETFEAHEFSADQPSTENDLHLTFLSYVHDPDPKDTLFEMILVYLINDHGRVEVIEDRHSCGLFPSATWLDRLEKASLMPELRQAEVWQLFVARHASG